MMYIENPFKIDVFVTGTSAYELSEKERAEVVILMDGVETRVLSPENIILRKLLWYEEGNRVSDRQWNDIVQIVDVQKELIDREYLDAWAERLGVKELAREALNQGES